MLNRDLEALLDLVACPVCRGELRHAGDALVCDNCGRSYGFCGPVPGLFPEMSQHEDRGLAGRLHHAVLANSRVYDFAQAHGGGRPIAAQLQAALPPTERKTVLDVGAGTGMVATLLPPTARYVWLDNDAVKLPGLLAKAVDGFAILGDAARLPIGDDAVDIVAMVEVSHHLPDDAFRAFLREAARVARERLVFVDGLRTPRWRSRVLWGLDLGRHPRTDEEVQTILQERFEIERTVRFRVNHDHVIHVARRRERTGRADD
jgi:SAM-dependent methyltransferase